MGSAKKFTLIIVACLLALNMAALTFYFLVFSPPEAPLADVPEPEQAAAPDTEQNKEDSVALYPALSDEYYSIHFNYGDAIELCSIEARSRNSNLFQLSVNTHSTRFKESEGIYLVKLDSHVGTPYVYEERAHTCEIDPGTQGVVFYKEIVNRRIVRPQQ